MDQSYRTGPFQNSELEHHYGETVHIQRDALSWTYLSRLGHPETVQPEVTELVRILYRHLLHVVISSEFPKICESVETRMAEHTPLGHWAGEIIDPSTKAISVDLARAGMVPSQVCFETLHRALPAKHIRQDHIVMNRATDAQQRVTGADVFGQKIGGRSEGAIILFPDPMGATGSSICKAIQTYKSPALGTPRKLIALHLIVTPEYIRKVTNEHPDVLIYAFRVDRGLSEEHILNTVPGTHWEQERGLNDTQYIVPGAGGLGEVLNNAEQ